MALVIGSKPEPIPRPRHNGEAKKNAPDGALKTRKFTIGPKPFSREEAKAWHAAMAPYPNLAENAEIAANAVDFVRQLFVWHDTRMLSKWRQFQVKEQLLRGNSLSRLFANSDIHVPELYSAVERMVPRIVEGVLSYDPWFHIFGRDSMDRFQAKRVQEWLRYLIDQDGQRFEERVEPFVRTFLIYNFVALKSWWSVEYDKRIIRDVEKTTEGPKTTYKITPSRKDTQTFEGFRYDVVDPYDFICDLREIDPQKMQFIGDATAIDQMQIRDRGEMFGWLNVDELIEQEQMAAWMWSSSWRKYSRSMDDTWGQDFQRRVEGLPQRLPIVEVWARWRPTRDHEWGEYKIVVGNGTTALMVQENPHDDKHRPYAVARSSKEPFDFLNVGPLDHSVRPNIELDEHHNIALKGHANSVCPPVLLDGQTNDIAGSLWDADPGQIISVSGTPHPMKTPSTVGEMAAMDASFRYIIEDATGALRVHESAAGANTATEVERKIQESNRRMRQLVINFSDGCTQLLRQAYALSQQFVTSRKQFRVLNGQAKALGIDWEIQPEDFQDPVDIVITGIRGLQSYGLRATQMATFLSQAGPLLSDLMAKGQINIPKLLSELWENLLGYRLDEDIIKIPQSAQDMLDPSEENQILAAGAQTPVHELDNDAQHKPIHFAYFMEWKDEMDHQTVLNFMQHMMQHEAQEARKAQRMAALGNENAAFEPGEPAEPKEPQTGRYDQEPDLTGGRASRNSPRETPGPPRAASMSAPDRASSMSQSANRGQE